jgi:hypothetical protein
MATAMLPRSEEANEVRSKPSDGRQLGTPLGFSKSRPRKPRKSEVAPQIKELIRQVTESNVAWRAPKIQGELLKLGFVISGRSVSRLMPKLGLSQ